MAAVFGSQLHSASSEGRRNKGRDAGILQIDVRVPDARTHGLFAEISVGIRATPRAGTRCDEWRSPRTSCAFTLAGGPRLAVACSQTGCQLAWLQFQPHAGTRRRRSVASATFTMARSACDSLRCPRMIGGRAPGELWGLLQEAVAMGMEAALDGGAGDCLITGYRCTQTAPNNAPPSIRPPRVPAAARTSLRLRERRKHGRSSGVRPLVGQAAVGLLLPNAIASNRFRRWGWDCAE